MSSAHPDKELFETVLKLKDGIQNVKERVLKLEQDYLNKIEQTETKFIHNKQIDERIQNLKTSKMIFLKYNEHVYPFSVENLKNNLFTSKKLLDFFKEGLVNNVKEVDIKPLHLSYISEIISFGSNFEVNQSFSFEDYSNINFYDDKVFISLLSMIFDFEVLNLYFNFKSEIIPKKDENFISRIELEKSDENVKLICIRANETELTDSKNINKKGLFLKANGKITIYFNRKIKTQKFYFRLFVNATVFKNGKSAFKIRISNDNGLTYKDEITYNTNENLNEVLFNGYEIFNTIQFSCTSVFSLSYLTFSKDE